MVFKLSLAIVTLAAAVAAANVRTVTSPGKRATNPACSVFVDLASDLQENLFNSQCGEEAREMVRLTFQDAVGFSMSGKAQGNGADGSILTFSDTELNFVENFGLSDAVDALLPFLERHAVSAGDLVQFAGAVGIANCPGAPALQFLAGRPNATVPAAEGLVPLASDSVSAILERVADVGLSSDELVHLLAAHSIAVTHHVGPTLPNAPLDTTPAIFDTQFYLEVLLKGVNSVNDSSEAPSPLPQDGEVRLRSDNDIARDNRTACEWQLHVNNQAVTMSTFKDAMAKVAVIGQDTSALIDCSEAVPTPATPPAVSATFPPGTGPDDLQLSCTSEAPFPTITSSSTSRK